MSRVFIVQRSKNKLKKWSVKEEVIEDKEEVITDNKEEVIEDKEDNKEDKNDKPKRGRKFVQKPKKKDNEKKKYGKILYFGQNGYRDYTLISAEDGKQEEAEHIKAIYLKRHKGEDWSDLSKAGCWARYLLWNLPTMQESAKDMEDRFNIKIILDTTRVPDKSEKKEE